jgi:hypothetical protein
MLICDKWTPLLLVTKAEDEEEEAEFQLGREGVKQPSSLVATRAKRHQKLTIKYVTGNDSDSPDEDIQVVTIIPHSARTPHIITAN